MSLAIYPGSTYERFYNANSGNVPEVNRQYAQFLNSLDIVDPTPVNDVIGFICRRITGPSEQHVIIFVAGRQGTGKSTLSGYIGERVDKRLNKDLGTAPKTHFSIENVRSVDKSGTLEMLDPDSLKERENQVFVLDDFSISSNSRNFQSPENRYINDILTTARIYRHCIIMNSIASSLVDAVARSYADLGIIAQGVIPGTSINRCRIYHLEKSNPLGLGKRSSENIGKYHQITVNGEQIRIVPWLAYKPSDEFMKAYKIVRKTNTDNLGKESKDYIRKTDATGKMDRRHVALLEKYDQVLNLRKEPDPETGKPRSMRCILREAGISQSGLDFLLGEAKKRGDLK